MLLEARLLDDDYIDPYYISPEGFKALQVGNLALLGLKDNGSATIEAYNGDIADLLLSLPSTAIMHFERPEDDTLRGKSTMLAVNYHDGHSEGHHKIVVQNPARTENGQWELWIPPGSNNTTFYRRTFHNDKPFPFENRPTNPEKIKNYYIHFGDADAAINDFMSRGFVFSMESPGNRLLDPTSEVYRLSELSTNNRDRWDPFAEK